jgi:hypothetical protein
MLPRVTSDATRQALLLALKEINDPRCAESVARALLATRNMTVGRLCEALLDQAAVRDPQRTQEALGGLLTAARDNPEQRPRAERMLEILTAHAAAPTGGR